MRDLVEKVLSAEQSARERIERATSEAAARKAEADRAAEALILEARASAAQTLKEALDRARHEAESLVSAGRLAAEGQAARWYAEREPRLDALAGKALERVLGVDLGAS